MPEDAAGGLGERATRWILDRAAAFVAFDPSDVSQLVRAGELGMFVHVAERSLGNRDPRIAAARDALRAALPTAPPEALSRSTVVLPAWLSLLLGAGDAEASARALAQLGAAPGDEFATERVPHRMLEVAWLVERLAWPQDLAPDRARAYAASYLGRERALDRMSLAHAYAATHVIAYVTDFGARPFEPAGDRERARRAVAAIVERARELGHLDLLGEGLAAAGWLQDAAWQPEMPAAVAAATALRSGACADGGILPVALPLADRAGAAPFEIAYHSTLVCALAHLAWCSPARGARVSA